MFSIHKLSLTIFIVSATLVISLFSCAPRSITRPTEASNDATTLQPAFTKTPVLPAVKPTATIIPDEPGFYKASISFSALENASQEQIVDALLHKWLEYHKTNLVSDYLRLKDYKIEKVKVMGYCPPPDKNTTKFLAEVQFSVQTIALHPGDWIAVQGNIILGQDHWIYHLSHYVSVSVSNGVYTLDFEGIPPCNNT